jgi:hypothetical protein
MIDAMKRVELELCLGSHQLPQSHYISSHGETTDAVTNGCTDTTTTSEHAHEYSYTYHLCRVGPLSELFLLPNGEKMSPSEEAEALRMVDVISAQALYEEQQREKEILAAAARKESEVAEAALTSAVAVNLDDDDAGDSDDDDDDTGSDVSKERTYRSPLEQYRNANMSQAAAQTLSKFSNARTFVELCKCIDDDETTAIILTVS